LWIIKDFGGVAVVQDPTDALVSSMPSHAIEEVGADHVLAASAMGALLGELARTPIGSHTRPGPETPVYPRHSRHSSRVDRGDLQRAQAITRLDDAAHSAPERPGVPSRFSCPDCGGVLWAERPSDAPLHLRCETGHAYSAGALAEAQTEAVEAAMWAALRALEDQSELARLRAGLARERGLLTNASQFDAELHTAQEHASAIRALLRLHGRAGLRPDVRVLDGEPLTDEGADRPLREGRTAHVSKDLRG
jgi:two-component system chemotaxis response regulator CheB